VASLPVELRSLVQRALTPDKVDGKSEHRACRRELPAVVLRMRDVLARDIARALENHMSADMSGFSELPRPMAETLAHRIRRMDLSLEKAIEGVKAARGSRAPRPGSALELQDACTSGSNSSNNSKLCYYCYYCLSESLRASALSAITW
jgi:hypothetical protein